MTEDWKYQIKLCALPDIGSVSASRLIKHFGSAKAVLNASKSELMQVERIGEKVANSIIANGANTDISKTLEKMSSVGARYICRNDSTFPKTLRELPDSPLGLYAIGDYNLNAPCISIVGCRNCSTYGLLSARRFAAAFARAGFTVVSGMARGIDSAAHFAALEAGGKTIAILGCGVDVIYPPENSALYAKIIEQGAILSEFPMGARADRQNFPIRNRLVSGISMATVVIESDIRGGSMITARLAAEQGRDVFAIPGNIDRPQSRGCNALIRDGVTLASAPEDVIDSLMFSSQIELNFNSSPKKINKTTSEKNSTPTIEKDAPKLNLNQDEIAILDALKNLGECPVDTLVEKLGMPAQKCSAILLMLEIKKFATKRGGIWSARHA